MMSRISEARTQPHKSMISSADAEAPIFPENKRIKWQRTGHSCETETVNRDVLQHGTKIGHNQLEFRTEDLHSFPQTTKEAEKVRGKAIAKWKQFPTKLPSNQPDIEKDEADSRQLHKLKAMVERLGGKLEGGWQVTSQRRSNNGSPFFSFISPTKEKFRSRIEVVRHLGLPASPANRKFSSATHQAVSNDQLALVPYRRRKMHSMKSSKVKLLKRKDVESAEELSKVKLLKSEKDHVPANKVLRTSKALKNPAVSQVARMSDLPASAITQRCRDILRTIISTQTFAVVSNIVSWGMPLPSMDATLWPSPLASSLDLKLINLRLSTGAYGQSPELFSTDIQQVWKNIIATGNELVSLAGTLSDLSECLYKQQMFSLFEEMPQGMMHPSRTRNWRSINDSYLFVSSPERASIKGQDDGSVRGMNNEILIKDYVDINCLPSACPAMQVGLQMPPVLKKKENTARYELRKKLGKASGKSKELLTSQGGLLGCSTHDACQNCNQREGHLVCNHYKATYYPNHLVPSSVPGGGCCTLCFLSQAAENAFEWETFGNGAVDEDSRKDLLFVNSNTNALSKGLQKPDAKAGICEICNIEDDNVLLCDACDAAYHMNCLMPPIQSVPDGYWYCPSCEEAGKNIGVFQQDMEFHNCSVCRRVSRELVNCIENESTAQVFSKDTSLVYLAPEHSMDYGCRDSALIQGASERGLESKPVAPSPLSEAENVCKDCGVDGGRLLISCSNCQNCYHLSCLRPALKKRPRKTWYCPSCLCRVCKIDVDDDKIILCDACDKGFHTYCLTPPLVEIPQEAWFCRSCMEARSIYPKVSEKRHEGNAIREG